MSRGRLLDAHSLLWWLFEAERLSPRSAEGDSPVLGKFVEVAEAEGFGQLPISATQAELAGSFSSPHADPWDRLLAAQAQLEGLTLITNDPKMDSFGIATCW